MGEGMRGKGGSSIFFFLFSFSLFCDLLCSFFFLFCFGSNEFTFRDLLTHKRH